jgi:beta-glucosidase
MDSMRKAPYKNPQLPISERINDLLSRMTIDEKVAQLMGVWKDGFRDFDADFLENPQKMREIFGNGVHSVHPAFWGIKETVEQRNTIQKFLMNETRLGIPAICIDEGLHGLMRKEATSFPQAIGLASSWNPELFEKVYSIVAHEMRSRGTHHAFTPVVDVCRDPRWGRVEETYGEDPYLNGVLSCATVKGLQGSTNGTIASKNVAATLKHFVGHGESEGGQNQGPANFSVRVLREAHMLPFKMCIDKVKPCCVMPSYNEIDGVPSHANAWLLKDVLRKEWGFDGQIICDYFAIDHLFGRHFIVKDGKDAAELAFNSGIQFEFPNAKYFKYLPALLNEGRIKLSDIDDAVRGVLKQKFEMGLFENPFVDLSNAITVSKNEEHKKTALTAALQSIVLLKNDKLLPLPKDEYKKIAVIGPCAKDTYLGGYAGEPYYSVSILDGIINKVGTTSEVLYAQGCKLTTNTLSSYINWKTDEISFASHEENTALITEAIEVAKQSEVIILAIGENEQLCREAWSKTHIGDNMTLDLFGHQENLVKAIFALGKPVVVYLMNGRPLSINYLEKIAPAIIEGWYMGQETGTAAADIIFGDVNPSGKLTITFPKSVGQLPMYYNHKPTAQYLDYISQDTLPLFPFGHGLSYTTFKYGEIMLSSKKMKVDGSITVSLDITNSGEMDGNEIVQLYIRDKVSSVTRPVMELKDFARILLKSGETKTVNFTIDKTKLMFWDINMQYVLEPGEFDIMVGSSSVDVKTVTFSVE